MQKEINLLDYLKNIEIRKKELGIIDSEEYTESLRNKGGNRTPEKLDMLANIEKRKRNLLK